MSALADESKDVDMADAAVDEDTADDVSPRQWFWLNILLHAVRTPTP
jgi:hypothetical protein